MKSRIRFYLLALFFLCYFCPSQPARAAEVFQEIVVKEGDTLWSLANYYLKDPNRWPEILKHNNLPVTDPMIALPGIKLKVPILLIKEHLRKAILVMLLNDVRFRKKDQAIWKKALQNMDLYNEDGLRTLDESRAHVKFFSGDILKLDENSLVILRPELKVEEVSLVSGAVRAARTKLITPTAHITPQSKDTVYKARIRDDQSTVVQVEKGTAEVFGVDTGKKVLVGAGFANITIPKQAPSVPVKSPDLPEFSLPDFTPTGNLIVSAEFKSKPAPQSSDLRIELEPPDESKPSNPGNEDSVKNKKKKYVNWTAYRHVVSKDPKFSVVDFQVEKQIRPDQQRIYVDPKTYNLPDGKYYQGVSYLDDSGVWSKIYPRGNFEIKNRPPKVAINFPSEGYQTREAFVNIEGQTEPKCFVYINNYTVGVTADGKFFYSTVLTKEGANRIKILVRDSAGNESKMERTVYLNTAQR